MSYYDCPTHGWCSSVDPCPKCKPQVFSRLVDPSIQQLRDDLAAVTAERDRLHQTIAEMQGIPEAEDEQIKLELQIDELKQENDKLRHHAEVMAKALDLSEYESDQRLFAAYRAEFQRKDA